MSYYYLHPLFVYQVVTIVVVVVVVVVMVVVLEFLYIPRFTTQVLCLLPVQDESTLL